LKIKVYGGGELVPALGAFDAVQTNAAEMGSGVSYYWAGKVPAAQFFASVPFGMNAQQVNAWLYSGGGLQLWEELYAEHGLVPLVGGNTGVQMGGWFNKEINTLKDLKGLKMRMPGLGGKVLEKAGGSPILLAGNELYTGLERGVIDATEWIGPYHDYKMGFYQIAKYYYTPGWHETGAILEFFINKDRFEELPSDLQSIVRHAAARINHWMLSEFEAKNAYYLKLMVNEHGVKLRQFPKDVLSTFRKHTKEVIEELVDSDPFSKRVYESYSKFQKEINYWSEHTEKPFYNQLMDQKPIN
jgi:TRAP-type mannitol/chloroaromatic compound transport system substrate-binding protein